MNESIESIVAEMRRRIAVKMSDAWYTQVEWRNLCDRIEAAWKRERAEVETDALAVGGVVEEARQKPVGNAAAMREALAKIRGIAKTFMDATRMRHVTDSARIDVGDIQELAKAALSAPARNCDMYDSYGDAIRAFEDTEDAEDYEEMAEWLFAPATEKEGEGDGK